MALKASMPLVCALDFLYENNKPQAGYVSKIISQAKGKIKVRFNHKESHYMPFWRNRRCLEKPPACFPSFCWLFSEPEILESSSSDPNIVEDMNHCVIRVGGDSCVQDFIKLQTEKYQSARKLLIEKHRKRQQTSGEITSYLPLYFPPEIFWSFRGAEYPELQRRAIRIVSQTCDGASKFNLTRSFAELMLTNGEEQIEIKALTDLTFVHYNRLQNFGDSKEKGIIIVDEVDPQSGWKYDLEVTND